MGKRSRARSASGRAETTDAPRGAGGPPAEDQGVVERARDSWRVAGERGPQVIKEPGRRPRAQRPTAPIRPRDGRERPPALWGTAPISEFAIAVGLILIIVGLIRGPDSPALTGGLVFITIAAIEFAAREHLRGYRSHTLFLAMLVVIAVHLGIATAIGGKSARGPAFITGDVVGFLLLAAWFSQLYQGARRASAPAKGKGR